MSLNQSRGEKIEPQTRRPGRSGSVAGRGYVGGGGRGGGGGGGFGPPVPAPAPSTATGRSFNKPGHGQGGQQPEGQPLASPQVGLTMSSPHVAVVNGPQSQPSLQAPGAHATPVTMATKPVEVSAPKPSRAVPRPPTSGAIDSTAPGTAGKGDASKQFTLQFGSIAPGFVNGMPIPARTSSAPPNLDEQKKDQASRGMYAASISAIPTSSVQKQQSHPPHKEAVGSAPVSSGYTHPPIEVKSHATQISTPVTMPLQKSSGVVAPGISMSMFQQPQPPLQFGGPNIPIQSQHVPAGSLQMPVPQMPMGSPPQLFLSGLQPNFVLQGQNLAFPAHIPHRVASAVANVPAGIGTQYSQQQASQFGGSRKTTVKITHPVTREELRLDKKTDSHIDPSGLRSNIPSQTQPLPFQPYFPSAQPNYASNVYYPIAHTQPTTSQGARFNFPVVQSGTPVSIVNPSTLTSVSVSKPGVPIQKDPELSHLTHSQGGKTLPVSISSQVQVTVKAAPSISMTTDKGSSAGPSSAVVKDGGLRVAKPLQEASFSSSKGSAVGPELLDRPLKERETELEIPSSTSHSSVKSTAVAPMPTDNHITRAFSSIPDQKIESCTPTPMPSKITESVSFIPPSNIEKKELPSSDFLKDDRRKQITDENLQQEQVASSSTELSVSIEKECYSSTSSDKHLQANHEHTNLLSKANKLDGDSSESGGSMTTGYKSHITLDPPGRAEAENGLKDKDGKSLGSYPITNGLISKEEPRTGDFDMEVPCQEDDSQLHVQQPQVADGSLGKQDLASLVKTSSDKDLLQASTGKDTQNTMVLSEQLGPDYDVKHVSEEVASSRLGTSIDLVKVVKSDIQSADSGDTSISLSYPESRSDSIMGLNVVAASSPKEMLQSVPNSDLSDKSQKAENDVETSGQISRSSSMVKDRVSSEVTRTKIVPGRRKKKEILSRADAAGTNSDLYMAYKGPEEQQISSVLLDGTGSSSTDDAKRLQVDEAEKDGATKEDGQSKLDIDDWENAVEIPSPKLEALDKFGRIDMAKKPSHELGVVSSKNKYSRDFLLTFSDQCLDLPTGFEIGPDVAPLLSVQLGSSHPSNNDLLPGHARIIDRPNPSTRADRRTLNYVDDDKWAKSTSLPTRDGGSSAGFRGASGATPGVLRNPRSQGGILTGQMQPLVAGGVPRNNIDADRWQRGTNPRGLIPSPQTPAQIMHKAERRYEIGKVSDEEEAKQRQIKAILNKLTPQNFDRLFQQVKDVNIDNATTLTGVISQIFDKALAEPTFCEMYSNFCLHLATALPDFTEDNEKITFKRLLLNKCQEEFERGEREQAEADKADEEGEVEQTAEAKEEKRVRARRRMLGNIRLIGELYKKKMLTERIMHACIKKLLGENQNPDEEDIEALCKLMSTIGEIIDHVKAKDHIDAYFFRMENLSENQKLSSRVRFMLKDALDLRRNGWQQRRKVEGPKKIEEVHRDAAQERAHVGRSARGSGMGASSRKGAPSVDYGSRNSMLSSSAQQASHRNISVQSRAYGSQDVRVEDKHLYESRTLSIPLSQRSKGDDSITLGPQGGLAKGMSSRGQPLMPNPPVTGTSSSVGESRRLVGPNGHGSISDRNISVSIRDRDLGRADRTYDRSLSKNAVDQTMGPSAGSSGASSPSVSLSEEQLRDKSIATIREYYSAKDEKEVGLCIKELNSPSFYPAMVSLWVTDSFERKDIERELLSKLLVSLCKSGDRLLSQAQLIEGLELVLSNLEDAVTDAPRAAEFVGRFFARTLLEDVLTLGEIGMLLQGGGEEPGRLLEIGLAADVLGNVLEIAMAEKRVSTLKELPQTSSMFSLESFRPPHPIKSKKLEQFL